MALPPRRNVSVVAGGLDVIYVMQFHDVAAAGSLRRSARRPHLMHLDV